MIQEKPGNPGRRARARGAGDAPAPAAHALSGVPDVVGAPDGRQGKSRARSSPSPSHAGRSGRKPG